MHGLEQLVADYLGHDVESSRVIEDGWDSIVFDVDGKTIVRVPRRAEVVEWIRKEAKLLPKLAAKLPVAVPEFEVIHESGVFFVSYRKLPGDRLDTVLQEGADATRIASDLGRFLAALHALPVAQVSGVGFGEAKQDSWLAAERAVAEQCERQVFPLLDSSERLRARRMFSDFLDRDASGVEPALVHADLGPAHILCDMSGVTGIIDWSDARIGDPAIDFGWLLHSTDPAFTTGLLEAYRAAGGLAEDDLTRRSLYYHRVGPWHEVLYGQLTGQQRSVDTGLQGIRARLP